jgi:hypothetical protein
MANELPYQMNPDTARQLYDRGFLSRENYMRATGGEDPEARVESPSPLTFDIPTPLREPIVASAQTEPAEPPPTAPLSLTTDPQDPAAATGQHGFTASGYGLPPLDLSGYNIQQQAVSEQYKQEADKAKAIYDEMERFNKDQDLIEAQNIKNEKYRQEQAREKWNKLSEANDRFANMKIDPGKFWADRTTGDKVMIAIGSVLGAFGAGYDNKAVGILQNAIERDISAQKANVEIASTSLQKKDSLYKNMLSIFDDEREAEKAARIVAYDNVKRKIGQITQGYDDPILRAKGMKLIGEIEVLKNNAVQDYFKLASDIALKEAQGVKAKGATVDKETLNLMADTKTTFWHIDRLMKINDKMFKSLNPAMKSEALIHVGKLVGLLRTPILGGGNLTDQERQYLEEIAADPTKFFSLSSSNRTKLKTLMEAAQRHLENRLNVRGIKTPEQQLGLIK